MIQAHQPKKLPANQLVIGLSSIGDGTMTHRSLPKDQRSTVDTNRQKFIRANGGTIERTALVAVTYTDDAAEQNYARYRQATSADYGLSPENPADALVTVESGVGLFLPLADCCGAVLYDTAQNILMVSHLGRHSVEQIGAATSVKYLEDNYGTKPENLYVWLSPSAGKDNYPVYSRGNRSLRELIEEDLLTAGVTRASVEYSGVDTTKDPEYYSHSKFVAANQPGIDGRFAIYAAII